MRYKALMAFWNPRDLTPWGFEPQFTDRKSVVLDQARRWGHLQTNGEGRWTRTIDTRLKRAVLYQLSYTPCCILSIPTLRNKILSEQIPLTCNQRIFF